MIPAPFTYFAPSTVDEAIALLQQHGEQAKLLAGGHSLVPLMKLRLATPAVVIDIGRLPDLAYIRREGDAIAVGALTTHHMLESSALLRADLPLVAEAAAAIGDVQVRNRGTIGGSLVHADPGGDLPAVALALDATLVLRGPAGERTVNAEDFFLGMLTTAIEPDEVLTAVRLAALPGRAGYAYQKAANKASGYAVVGIAAAVALAADGTVAAARRKASPAPGRSRYGRTRPRRRAGRTAPDGGGGAAAAGHAAAAVGGPAWTTSTPPPPSRRPRARPHPPG
ncbi:MAG: FAD binding domain-containing protein [Dehalococcoidia bacterium]